MTQPLRVFIGYDSREPVAYHVAAHSIMSRASKPVAIIPLIQSQLRATGLYTRERGPTESTEFSLTRFLMPYLSGYEGLSVFMDSDILCRTDINRILWEELWQKDAAVLVCKHDYTPKSAVKMDGCVQTAYPRKNWSSVMLFNNARCSTLTPEYVSRASGRELHQFYWLGAAPDRYIGSLPLAWNYLVGEENQTDFPPAIVHFTNGGPWMDGYEDVEYADEWRTECAAMNGVGVALNG